MPEADDDDDDSSFLSGLLERLDPKQRDEVTKAACVHALVALVGAEEADRYQRSRPAGPPIAATPEMLAGEFLWRCMPSVPLGYADDSGFVGEYEHRAALRLKWNCVDVILGSGEHDDAHALAWAQGLTECAREVAPSFMLRDVFTNADVGAAPFMDVGEVKGFIKRWRRAVIELLTKRRDGSAAR